MSQQQNPNTRQPGIGLSFVVALASAAGIALAMAAYAAYEFWHIPGLTVKQLFLHHLSHVLLLGAVIHLATWLALRFLLSRQLDQIYVHLYGIGEGKLQPLKLDTRIREIKLIVDGINLMIWRIGRSQDDEAFAKAEQDLIHLKHAVKRVTAENPTMLADLTESVENLERSLLSLTQEPPNALATN